MVRLATAVPGTQAFDSLAQVTSSNCRSVRLPTGETSLAELAVLELLGKKLNAAFPLGPKVHRSHCC